MLHCRLHSNITTYQQHASRIVLCEVPRAVGVCNTSSNIRVFGALLRTSGLEFQGRADCAWLFEPNGMVEMVTMGSASHLTRHVFNFLIVLACSLNSFWWLEPIEFRNSLAHQISSPIKSSPWPMHSQLWALPCLMMPWWRRHLLFAWGDRPTNTVWGSRWDCPIKRSWGHLKTCGYLTCHHDSTK